MFQFFKSIPQIFYSQPFYANLIRRGKGIGAGFIFLQAVLLFTTIALSAVWGSSSLSNMQKDTEAFFDRLPSLTIKQQKLSIDRPSPYFIDISAKGQKQAFIVFDTTPREKDVTKIAEDMKTKNMIMLFTSDFAAVPKKSSMEFFDFSGLNGSGKDNLAVSHDDWVSFGKALFTWGIPVISVLLSFYLFILGLIGTFFKSLLVMLCAYFFTIRLDISAAMRLSAAATIPVGVMGIILVPFHISIAYPVALLFTLAFAFFGLMSANKEVTAEKK